MQKARFIIPFKFRARQIAILKPKILERFGNLLDSNDFVHGPAVSELEEKVAEFIGVKHAVAVSAGEEAIYIALAACGLHLGEEVLTNPFCAMAVIRAADRLTAIIKFIDIDPDTYTMNEQACERAITESTKIVMTLYPYGEAWNKGAVTKITAGSNVQMIEEITQAFGGYYNGARIGSQSNAAVIGCHQSSSFASFGDGGIILTNEDNIAANVRRIREHGHKENYWQKDAPYRYRMDEFQAGVLCVKLEMIDGEIARRKEIFQLYREKLQGINGLKLPYVPEGMRPSFSMFTIRLTDGRRDQVLESMLSSGIEVQKFYELPVRRGVWMQESKLKNNVPIAFELSGQVMNLPCDASMENSEVEQVASALINSLQS